MTELAMRNGLLLAGILSGLDITNMVHPGVAFRERTGVDVVGLALSAQSGNGTRRGVDRNFRRGHHSRGGELLHRAPS